MCGELVTIYSVSTCKPIHYGKFAFWKILIFDFCFKTMKWFSNLLMNHFFKFQTGIFAYLNFCVPRNRKYILEALVKGLQRLEYRGYDSAGK